MAKILSFLSSSFLVKLFVIKLSGIAVCDSVLDGKNPKLFIIKFSGKAVCNQVIWYSCL